MRVTTTIAVALALAGLAACNRSEPAAEPAAAPAATEAAAWTPTMPSPGSYVTTTSDGKPYSTVSIETDSSYARVPAGGGAREAGIAKMTDGKLCFDPSGEVNPERCYAITQPTADGSFTATDDKGMVLNVKPAA